MSNKPYNICGIANCGCVHHAEQGIPCEHDFALAQRREDEAHKWAIGLEGPPPEVPPTPSMATLMANVWIDSLAP
jgi:hypothetical protein